MSRGVEELWERLVGAALSRERTGAGNNVPSALAKNRDHIEEILSVVDEIEDDDPTISRTLCEHAFSLSQKLDPNSEGRGVLQFRAGLMSLIKQKVAKREVGSPNKRHDDVARLQEFYKSFKKKNNMDESQLKESGTSNSNLDELEHMTVKREKVLATLKVLGTVLEQLSEEMPNVVEFSEMCTLID